MDGQFVSDVPTQNCLAAMSTSRAGCPTFSKGGKMKTFDIKELGILKDVCNRTRQEISADLVEIVGAPVARDIICETVFDRLMSFADTQEEIDICREFLSQTFDEMMEIKTELFPFENYE